MFCPRFFRPISFWMWIWCFCLLIAPGCPEHHDKGCIKLKLFIMPRLPLSNCWFFEHIQGLHKYHIKLEYFTLINRLFSRYIWFAVQRIGSNVGFGVWIRGKIDIRDPESAIWRISSSSYTSIRNSQGMVIPRDTLPTSLIGGCKDQCFCCRGQNWADGSGCICACLTNQV